jgi:hypothetical protein
VRQRHSGKRTTLHASRTQRNNYPYHIGIHALARNRSSAFTRTIGTSCRHVINVTSHLLLNCSVPRAKPKICFSKFNLECFEAQFITRFHKSAIGVAVTKSKSSLSDVVLVYVYDTGAFVQLAARWREVQERKSLDRNSLIRILIQDASKSSQTLPLACLLTIRLRRELVFPRLNTLSINCHNRGLSVIQTHKPNSLSPIIPSSICGATPSLSRRLVTALR